MHAARKDFDSKPDWVERENREGVRLTLTVPLLLDGEFGGGVEALLSTPKGAWEEDLYGQITVRHPAKSLNLRVCPVEWRPLKTHDNSGDAPKDLRFQTLSDRFHPFDLNKALSLEVFAQRARGIAAPLPRAIASFSDYIDLCADLWNCPNMRSVPPPPWAKVLL